MKRIELTVWLVGLATALVVAQGCQQSQKAGNGTQPAGSSSSQQSQNPAPPAQMPSSSAPSQPAPMAQSSQGSGNPFQVLTTKIPAGAVIRVRNNMTLTTSSNQTGDDFDAILEEPLTVNGVVVAPKDATAEGKVVLSDKGLHGTPTLVLTLHQITLGSGDQLNVQTDNITIEPMKGNAGGVSEESGGLNGKIISTRSDEAEINSQSLLEFRVTQPVTVTTAMK